MSRTRYMQNYLTCYYKVCYNSPMTPEGKFTSTEFFDRYNKLGALRKLASKVITQSRAEGMWEGFLNTDLKKPQFNEALKKTDDEHRKKDMSLATSSASFTELYVRTMLDSYAMPVTEAGIHTAELGVLDEFVDFYDFYRGVKFVADQFILAEAEVHGETDNLVEKIVDRSKPINEQIELSKLLREIISQNTHLLGEDPTGERLLKHSVEAAENDMYPITHMDLYKLNLDYVLEGVRFAEKSYKTVYPLIEKLRKGNLPPQSEAKDI